MSQSRMEKQFKNIEDIIYSQAKEFNKKAKYKRLRWKLDKRFKISRTILFDSAAYPVLRDDEKLERYVKIWWKFLRMEKIRQGFYKDGNNTVYVGFINNPSNFNYKRCGLLEHCWTHSSCENLTPISFKEGLDLWTKSRREEFDAINKRK